MTRRIVVLVAALLLSCASSPRPRVLSDLDAVSEGAQARESQALAPQAHARAELLRAQAERAHADHDTAGAQILSERALAAYGHAFVLARIARAEKALEKANQELGRAKLALSDVEEKHKRVAAEADELELKVKVAEDALPLVPNAPAGPERERARLEAARALAVQARLLCLATRLLEPTREGLDATWTKLGELDKTLASTPKATPIDSAGELRSACLKHLTLARRSGASAESGSADALLSELSRAGSFAPFRDDRGVVVTLRSVVDAKGGLTADAQKAIELLARVAKAHPKFPLLVVVHGRPGADEAQKKAVTQALANAGATRVESASAGSAQPVVDPARPGSQARNDRVEIVFVAPGK